MSTTLKESESQSQQSDSGVYESPRETIHMAEPLNDSDESSCDELPEYIKPLESAEDYKDFVKQLVEILRIVLQLFPCQLTSLTKLAVEMMLTEKSVVHSDLHQMFIASLLEFYKNDAEILEDKIFEGMNKLTSKKVEQQNQIATGLRKKLKDGLEVFAKFQAINLIDENIKRQIEEEYLSKCARSGVKDPKDLLGYFEDHVSQLSKHEITVEPFRIMTFEVSIHTVSALLARELEYMKAGGEIVENEIQERVKEFTQFHLEIRRIRYLASTRYEMLKTAFRELRSIIVDYCKAGGIHHIETMSILAVNILLAKTKEESKAFLCQIKCFMGNRYDKENFSTLNQTINYKEDVHKMSLMAKKLFIQMFCLFKFEQDKTIKSGIDKTKTKQDRSEKKADEYYNPLCLIGQDEIRSLESKLLYKSSGKDHFKHWQDRDQKQSVSFLMLKATLAQTKYLTGLTKQEKDAVKDAMKKTIEYERNCTPALWSEMSDSSRFEANKESESEIIAQAEETDAAQNRSTEEKQSVQADASKLDGDDSSDIVRSDI